MPVHLLKLAVVIESIDHLIERQKQRMRERTAAGDANTLRILTRNTPRRADELTAEGGSIFWVIKNRVLVRQQVTRVEPTTCLLYTSPSPRDLSTSRMPSSA